MTDKEPQRDLPSIHSLANDHNGKFWAKLNPGAKNSIWVSYMNVRGLSS